MGAITKKDIISLINEQMSSDMQIDELPRIKAGEEQKDWTNPVEISPVTFKEEDFLSQAELNQFVQNWSNERGDGSKYTLSTLIGTTAGKLISLNPELLKSTSRIKDTKYTTALEEELIPNVAICYRVRESKTIPEFKMYLFDNYGYLPATVDVNRNKEYHKRPMFILVSETNPTRPLALLADLRRNRFLDTQWKQPEEPQYTSETYAKRYVHYKNINKLFSRNDIKVHMYRCGLPPIMAYKEFDQPITHKINKQKYTAPYYDFLLSGIWPASDIQAALSLIIEYREAIESGDEPPIMPQATHMPRNPRYEIVYEHGNWLFSNKIAGPEKAEKTRKLKLWMKAIAGGELSFYIGTDLQVIGTIERNNMIMSATLSVVSETRTAGKEWANYKITPIQPIIVHTIIPIPPNIKLYSLEDDDLTLQRGSMKTEEYEFLTQMYNHLLGQLGEKILEIDPDEALNQFLMFEPEELETNIQERKKPKLKITESQLKMLIKK